MEEEVLKKEYFKYLESSFLIKKSGNDKKLEDILKDYIDKGYRLLKLSDGFGFLEKPSESLGAIVKPNGEIMTDFIYRYTMGFVPVFNFNKSKKLFPVTNSLGLYGVIDENGKEIVPCKYYYVVCQDDFIIVRVQDLHNRDGLCGLLDKTGNLIIPTVYDYIGKFNDGLAAVANDKGLWGYINQKGEEVIPCQYRSANEFSEGLAVVKDTKNRFGVIDQNNNVVIDFSSKYIDFGNFENGISFVSVKSVFNKSKKQTIDRNGKVVDFEKKDNIFGYEATYKFRSYKLNSNYIYYSQDGKTKYSLKYQPIYEFDNFTICVNGNELYAFDKRDNSYQLLLTDFERENLYSYGNGIFFDNNSLSLKNSYFYFDDKIINLGDVGFQKEKIEQIEKKNDLPILSFEEFSKEFRKNPDLNSKLKEEAEYLEKKKNDEEIKNRHIQTTEKVKSVVSQMSGLQEQLNNLEHYKEGSKVVITKENFLFENLDDHKEFRDMFKTQPLLQYLDLKYISFDNVNVSGMDLSYTNADIDPQKVYNKDMSNGNYNGLYFVSKNFDGVDIRGANFTDCVFDFANFDGAIIDDTTILPSFQR